MKMAVHNEGYMQARLRPFEAVRMRHWTSSVGPGKPASQNHRNANAEYCRLAPAMLHFPYRLC